MSGLTTGAAETREKNTQGGDGVAQHATTFPKSCSKSAQFITVAYAPSTFPLTKRPLTRR